jgi:hypothetical protein
MSEQHLRETLWFLSPTSPRWDSPEVSGESGPQMPDAVWQRLLVALEGEDDREAARVVRIGEAASKRSARRLPAWTMGAVAAGVALVVGGVVVQSVQSTDDVAVVAAVQDSGAFDSAPTAKLAAPGQPSRRVLASGTDYQPSTLRSQVVGLLESIGARKADQLQSIEESGPSTMGEQGFTATLAGLRDCITGLTRSERSQALVVDRASYLGVDAGLVIIPVAFVPRSSTLQSAEPSATFTTPSGDVDVWVVGPDCSKVEPRILQHVLHSLN